MNIPQAMDCYKRLGIDVSRFPRFLRDLQIKAHNDRVEHTRKENRKPQVFKAVLNIEGTETSWKVEEDK